MARITVEDCVDKVSNRFDLILLSAHRVHQLSAGAEPCVPLDNDKKTVLALREIAVEVLDPVTLRESLIESARRLADFDEPDLDELDLAATSDTSINIVTQEKADRNWFQQSREDEYFED